jgi:hypothetical protein
MNQLRAEARLRIASAFDAHAMELEQLARDAVRFVELI